MNPTPDPVRAELAREGGLAFNIQIECDAANASKFGSYKYLASARGSDQQIELFE